MMSDSRPRRFPRGLPSRFALAAGLALILLATATPAGATLKSVTPSPTDPTACDPVTLTVAGELSSPCYEIVGAKIDGPREIPCMRIFPCPFAYVVEITVREPAPGTPCPAVIEPYTRAFELGKLPAGEYHVRAVERVIPYSADSSGVPVDSSFAFTTFTSYPDTACTPGFGCYILDFVPDPPDAAVIPDPFCTAKTLPGGTAWIDLALLNSIPVGGLQATVALPVTRDGISPQRFIHPVMVEAAPRASHFQVAWSATGSDLKFVLYSTAGAAIPAGRGPVLRIQYATAPGTPPAVYPIVTREAIVADSTGEAIEHCPTFAPIEPGRLCVVGPSCDVNGDGSSDILDIIRLARCVLDTTACPDTIAARADCNADHALDVRDIICCVRKILSAGCTFCERDAPSPDGSRTEIGFAGSVRWINDVDGIATVEITPGADLAGIQFSVTPSGGVARVRDMKLIEGPSGTELLWAADGAAGGKAAIYSLAPGQVSTGPLRVEVAVERTVGGSGTSFAASTLDLGGVLGGTSAGIAAATELVNPSIVVPETPVRVPAMLPARPNPFRSSTELGFVLPSDSRVSLRIYDVAGRLVRTVADGSYPAGVHRMTWDGKDSGGRTAGTGLYFAKWNVGTAGGSERLLLLK